jgi:hypothetical protein
VTKFQPDLIGEVDRHEAAGLLSARATGDKIESDDRSSV